MKAIDRIVTAYAKSRKSELTDEQRALVHREISKAVHEFMGRRPAHSALVDNADTN